MLEKGSFEYIKKKKKRKIIMVVAIIVIAAAIFGIGLLLNKMSRANIFTVLAILCVLPWAKQLVALIVLFPYHSVSRERYDKARKCLENSTGSMTQVETGFISVTKEEMHEKEAEKILFPTIH